MKKSELVALIKDHLALEVEVEPTKYGVNGGLRVSLHWNDDEGKEKISESFVDAFELDNLKDDYEG